MSNKSATLETPEDIFSIGLNKVVTLIAEAKPGDVPQMKLKT